MHRDKTLALRHTVGGGEPGDDIEQFVGVIGEIAQTRPVGMEKINLQQTQTHKRKNRDQALHLHGTRSFQPNAR